jgi:hypothetical protein
MEKVTIFLPVRKTIEHGKYKIFHAKLFCWPHGPTQIRQYPVKGESEAQRPFFFNEANVKH